MKNLSIIGMISVLALAVSGCASTTTSKEPVYPELKVLSDKTYVWDNSISEALNVARMAQPAGVGVGMEDFADGTKATTGRYSGGERMVDAVLGVASMGIFGLVSMESLNQGVNNKLDWKPATVDLVKEVDVLDNNQYSFVKLRSIIANKHKSAIEKKFNSIVWGDTLTMKDSSTTNVSVIIKSPICSSIREFQIRDKSKAKPYLNVNYSKHFTDGKDLNEDFCIYGLKVSIAGKRDLHGEKHLIVVSEITDGFYLIPSITKFYKGYMIVPDFYELNSVDAIIGKYAYVSKEGAEFLFESK